MGYVAPVHQWKVNGACISCPLSIPSATADSRIGLKLFGQIPYTRSVAQFFFHLGCGERTGRERGGPGIQGVRAITD